MASQTFQVTSAPLHIAHLAAAPLVAGTSTSESRHPLDQLDISSERRMLQAAIRESRREVSIRFDTATSDNLIRAVHTHGARALHYSGHGVKGSLVFEDAYMRAHFMQNEALGALLRAGGRTSTALRFVFVSACHSPVQVYRTPASPSWSFCIDLQQT